jgi:hypothetical protein
MNTLHYKWPRRRRAAEQRDELAAPHHSITSSARASSVGGTSRSGAFAVLTLRAVTNLVAMGEDYDISVRGGRRVSGTWLAIQART